MSVSLVSLHSNFPATAHDDAPLFANRIADRDRGHRADIAQGMKFRPVVCPYRVTGARFVNLDGHPGRGLAFDTVACSGCDTQSAIFVANDGQNAGAMEFSAHFVGSCGQSK